MGEEIQYSRFKQSDYARFKKSLHDETQILNDWFNNKSFSNSPLVAGYELEAWLIDQAGAPCPNNEQLLQSAHNELLSPELAKFNIELNVKPQLLKSSVLSDFESSLIKLWDQCQTISSHSHCSLLGIGILPTLQDKHLILDNLSTLDRYRALNEQVLVQRNGEPIKLNIVGREHLQTEHLDVMLEAAATSLQIHIQTPQDQAVSYYNASIAASAPLVAVSANSPFLFGKNLWEETRIPVFEQAVATGGFDGAAHGPIQRVSFGSGYARESLFECFSENIEHFPILLPVEYDNDERDLRHLRLHNGTIWRWNRPLIGFDEDGTPHMRIEHRVTATAPSNIDNIANIAFYYGLAHYYANFSEPVDQTIPFPQARDNFYLSAQHGLNAHVVWDDKQHHTMKKLILDRLLIEAETGLQKLFLDEDDIKKYLGVIDERTKSEQTGSVWQRNFASKHQNDMHKLTMTYFDNQKTNQPVHTWDYDSQ